MLKIRIRELRVGMGLSQGQLAEALGLDQSLVSRYETTERLPDLRKLERFAEFFKCSVRDLIEDQAEPGPEAA